MGIIDDYYGGYESLALFTNSDGEVDFDAAYEAQLPDFCDDEDDYYALDEFERAVAYKLKMEMENHVQKISNKKLPGWRNTGNKTYHGKPIYEGHCSHCNKLCTVPFAPRASGDPPMCKACLNMDAGPGSELDSDLIDALVESGDDDTEDPYADFPPAIRAAMKQQMRSDLEQIKEEVRAAKQHKQQRQQQRDQHKKQKGGHLLLGWTPTGNTTFYGKPIYQGNCSSCHKPTTVPFAPVAGASPPMCKQCLGQHKGLSGAGSSRAAAAAGATVVGEAGTLQHEQQDV